MTILVTGTLAIDHIAEVADGFEAGDLNGKLHQPQAHWGGCGMNLAYGLSRASRDVLPWVFYGDNCPDGYLAHLQTNHINATALCPQRQARCAEAYIFTRSDGSQLTGFYPGSTQFEAPEPAATAAIADCVDWIAGPEDDATLLARLPYIAQSTQLYWMPGQYADVTRNNVLEPMLERRPHLVVNETEWSTLVRAVGEQELGATTGSVFITQGSDGVRFRLSEQSTWQHCPTDVVAAVDPTGCGDAFCASLVGYLSTGMDARSAIELSQRLAARCLGLAGAQNY